MRAQVLAWAAVLLVSTSALAQKVTIDYEAEVDFASYRTFAWFDTEATSLVERYPLLHSRLVNGVEHYLSQAGMSEVDPDDDPDLRVTYHTNAVDETRVDMAQWGYGYGDPVYDGSEFANTSRRQVTYTVGTLVLDIWDARTGVLIWRGVATETVTANPDKMGKKIDRALKRLHDRWRKVYRPPSDGSR